jgi:hypothetical protein
MPPQSRPSPQDSPRRCIHRDSQCRQLRRAQPRNRARRRGRTELLAVALAGGDEERDASVCLLHEVEVGYRRCYGLDLDRGLDRSGGEIEMEEVPVAVLFGVACGELSLETIDERRLQWIL